MVERIISGGQTGADRTGLEVARELGIATGGYVPKGCRTDEGPAPELVTEFGCEEHHSWTYPPRTRLNVWHSDGTVLFGNMDSPGCALTIRLCHEHNKPYLTNPSAEDLREWLDEYSIKVLNVAGNRKRTNPGVVALTRSTLLAALRPSE